LRQTKAPPGSERRAGEILAEAEKNKGAVTPFHLGSASQKLSNLGITRMQSHRWQELAAVPEKKFEEQIAATSRVRLPRGTNPWAATDLLVSETVGGTIELADVEALRFRACGVAGDDDLIARLQGLAGHADFD